MAMAIGSLQDKACIQQQSCDANVIYSPILIGCCAVLTVGSLEQAPPRIG